MFLLKKYIKEKWSTGKYRCAGYLQRKSELLSVKGKKIFLAVFSLLFAGSSLYVMIHSITHSTNNSKAIQIHTIATIKLPENKVIAVAITKEAFERVERYKNLITDSIKLARPQLMDSIKEFEHIYQQQKK